jgi:hypothetical protein
VLLGSLLELLVVCGGIQGTLEAAGIVDNCHDKGAQALTTRTSHIVLWLMHTIPDQGCHEVLAMDLQWHPCMALERALSAWQAK